MTTLEPSTSALLLVDAAQLRNLSVKCAFGCRLFSAFARSQFTTPRTLIILRTTHYLALAVVWVDEWSATNQVATSAFLSGRRRLGSGKHQADCHQQQHPHAFHLIGR